MFQLAAASLTLLTLFVLYLSGQSGSDVLEHTVASGSKYLRFDRSRVPPPDFNSAQSRVDIDEPADDPIWDIQNSTLGVSCCTLIFFGNGCLTSTAVPKDFCGLYAASFR
jgi:hypothetical protein